jgi:DAK2 domain fusion protein YloV
LKYTTIDGQLLKEMLLSGAYELENNKALVNSLNVFPVPDGDTGTNMSATMMSAAAEIQTVKNVTVQSVTDAVTMGSLMGARGNSGVILSQLLRGISKHLKSKTNINTKDFANALKEGVSTAYRAVMKPTEGTILTVARESAEKAVDIAKNEEDFGSFLKKVYDQAVISLNKTPNLLPVLKQAGVVDAGGKGLVFIYLGMVKRLESGLMTEKSDLNVPVSQVEVEYEDIDTGDIKFTYCTEFFIKTQNANPDDFKKRISIFGDSMVVVGTENLIKVHIHTNEPGTVLQEALTVGELSKIKIDNMKEQHRSITEEISQDSQAEDADKVQKEYAMITVAMGDGITDIFKDLGVDVVIEGGQTMNPSTQDILAAVNSVSANNIFILPNNGNIVMAAQQARDISNKNVTVIPTKSIPQGITAVVALNPDASPEENMEEMNKAILRVKTGQVTYAVRDTVFNDVEIKEGNILGIYNGKLTKAGSDLDKVTKELLDSMIDDDSELITILYGNNLTEDNTTQIQEFIAEKYPDCEVSVNYGGQPLYYYIVSVE